MRDFNFVSVRIHWFWALSFWKTVKIFFINVVLKVFWLFLQNVSIFHMFEFCFFFFVMFRKMDFCLRWLVVVSMSRMLNNGSDSFLFFNLIFNFQKSRLSFVTVFLTLCLYSSHYCLYHFSFVMAPTNIFVLLLSFSVSRKLHDFSFLLGFRHFFGLQLVSFNMWQYWEFARKPSLKFPLSIFRYFLPALLLFLNDSLHLNFILLFSLFYDQFCFWINEIMFSSIYTTGKSFVLFLS